MSERRMLTKKVTDDDNFMALSSSAQALYLHLTMSADDDGFCNQVSLSMFKAHASVQDLQALLEKRYILQFEDGVIVIKHWRMANSLRKDRYTPTAFQEDLRRLEIKENGVYTLLPDGCRVVAERLPQDSIGKDRLVEDRLDKGSIGEEKENTISNEIVKKKKIFVPPTLEEVEDFCYENSLSIDPAQFIDFYETNGWMVGRNHMKDWKAAARNWDRRRKTDDKGSRFMTKGEQAAKDMDDSYKMYAEWAKGETGFDQG